MLLTLQTCLGRDCNRPTLALLGLVFLLLLQLRRTMIVPMAVCDSEAGPIGGGHPQVLVPTAATCLLQAAAALNFQQHLQHQQLKL